MREVIDIILSLFMGLMRRQLRFVMFIAVVFVAALLYSGGLTATTVTVMVIVTVVIGLFSMIVWFWSAVIRSLRSDAQKENSP